MCRSSSSVKFQRRFYIFLQDFDVTLYSLYQGSRRILQLLKWPCRTSFFTHVEPSICGVASGTDDTTATAWAPAGDPTPHPPTPTLDLWLCLQTQPWKVTLRGRGRYYVHDAILKLHTKLRTQFNLAIKHLLINT